MVIMVRSIAYGHVRMMTTTTTTTEMMQLYSLGGVCGGLLETETPCKNCRKLQEISSKTEN